VAPPFQTRALIHEKVKGGTKWDGAKKTDKREIRLTGQRAVEEITRQ